MFYIYLAVTIIAAVTFPIRAAGQGAWSKQGVSLPQSWDSSTKPVAVFSPDKTLVLRIERKKTGQTYPQEEYVPDYFLEERGHRLQPAIHPYAMPEALWSPDSDILAITSSDGGLVGNWKVYTYTVSGGAVLKHDVMKRVQADLATAFPAEINPPGASFFSKEDAEKAAKDTSWVNLAAVHWLRSPERLIVLAGVPPSSSYGKNMGKRRGYMIDPISGNILRTYSAAEFQSSWGKYLTE